LNVAGPRDLSRAFFGGRHHDTDRGFINEVNQPLHFMLGSSMIVTIFLEMLIDYIHVSCVQKPALKDAYLQIEMDNALEGLDFPYPLQLGTHLAYFTIIMIYSTALPTLFLLWPLYMTINYWYDKTMLLRLCKIPPRYSEDLMDYATYCVVFAIVVHLFMAIWILGTPAIFPMRVLAYEALDNTYYFLVEQMSVVERLVNSQTSIFLLLMIILLGLMFIVEPTALGTYRICCTKPARRGETGYAANL
jgi:hypothetical protein